MNELSIETKKNFTSLELVEEINKFRKEEGKKNPLRHYDLLKVIRDEFEEEINEGKISLVEYKEITDGKISVSKHKKNTEGKISLSEYKDETGRKLPMYVLTLNQAKQILIRESKFVRRAIIGYIEFLESKIKAQNEMKLIGYQAMEEDYKRIKFASGDGENLKAIACVGWLKDYFYLDKRNIIPNLYRILVTLSNEKQIPYDGIISNVFGGGEVLVFHTMIYDYFKKMLDKDEEYKILPNFRRFRG